ncbi:class I SAM-dependent methyltransferase [Methanoculleus oceani]|uniref:class I SAM-dependent methyltransferase n=1 Tax=Methanoculleus oceani TaxID=2184756 RepID=UPI00332D19A8
MSPPEEYADEAEFYSERIIRRTGHGTLLHLGCGGGHLDLWLKGRFTLTGVDMSEEMLALARRLNPEATYISGDMRTVRLGRTFDAVIAHDAINYMLTPEDLRAVFETAYLHLRPGGIFLTLVERRSERFLQNRTDCSAHTAGDIGLIFIQNEYDPDPSDSTYEVTLLYLIHRDGELEIVTDRHVCGIFPLSLWLDLLKEAGFSVSVEEYMEDGERYPVPVCIK